MQLRLRIAVTASALLVAISPAGAQPGSLDLWPAGGAATLARLPIGTFSQVTLDTNVGVAIRSDGTLAGWGDNSGGALNNLPSGTFSQVVEFGGMGVGLRTDGTVAKWGADSNNTGVLTGSPGAGVFTEVRLGFGHAGALRDDGVLKLWGGALSPIVLQGAPGPTEVFTTFALGFSGGVALREDGTLRAWGTTSHGLSTPPAGTYIAVAAAGSVYLALRPDGTIEAWGNPADPIITTLPSESFVAIQAWALTTAAAQRPDGTWVIWGNAAAPVLQVPSVPYTQIAMSGFNGVGIRPLAAPGPTATTYQGQLLAGATPAAGLSDATFTVFDSPEGGSPIGWPTEQLDLPLDSGGRLTTTFDPGPGVFDGAPRWLEVAVRHPAGSGDYTPLSPRTPITAAPYAAYAVQAASVPWTGITGQPFSLTTQGDLSIPGSLALGGSMNRLVVTPTFTAEVACADFKIGFPSRRGSPGRALVDSTSGSPRVLVLNFQGDWDRVDVNSPMIVSGSVTASGFVNSSDARLKDHIEPLTGALDEVLRLRPVRFEWRAGEFPERRLPAGPAVGLLAQDVRAVFPELVSVDPMGMLAVDYGRVSAVTIGALRELAEQSESRARDLERRVAALEARLAELESRGHDR